MIEESFSSTLRYQSTAKPAEILTDMARFGELDKVHEVKERFWRHWMIACIVAAVLSGIASFFIMSSTHQSWVFSFPVLAVIGAIVCGVMMKRRGRMNLDNRRYELTQAVVDCLSRDMAADQQVGVTIDFNHYHQANYRRDSEGGMLSSSSSSSYALPWLSLEGMLLDGTRFHLTTSMTVRRKERRKRKYTKVKESFEENVTLMLRVKPRRYDGLERLEQVIRGSKFPPNFSISDVQVKDSRITVQAQTQRQTRLQGRGGAVTGNYSEKNLVDRDAILMLLLACYHGLGQCEANRRSA